TTRAAAPRRFAAGGRKFRGGDRPAPRGPGRRAQGGLGDRHAGLSPLLRLFPTGPAGGRLPPLVGVVVAGPTQPAISRGAPDAHAEDAGGDRGEGPADRRPANPAL